ncbi:MAG: hypothetical protein L3J04_07045 [Robiginitomaculum sp.]|nr:hypothetical protein [Robiginitomaculum sp.]
MKFAMENWIRRTSRVMTGWGNPKTRHTGLDPVSIHVVSETKSIDNSHNSSSCQLLARIAAFATMMGHREIT